MNEMHYVDLLGKVERLICQVVQRCYPTSWDEDHITYSITDELGSLGTLQITGLHRPFYVVWDARKFTGPTETAFGDLGVLVSLTAWDGQQLEGIGFLEAKKRSPETLSFDAVRKGQLTRIEKNAPRARLLLYDNLDITDFGDNLPMASMVPRSRSLGEMLFGREEEVRVAVTQAVAVPLNLALAVNNFKTSLYKYSLPLSVQLCGRYLRGLDLEFDEKILRQAKGFIERRGGPRYLLLIGISNAEGEPVLPRGLNDNLYRPLRGENR